MAASVRVGMPRQLGSVTEVVGRRIGKSRVDRWEQTIGCGLAYSGAAL